MPGRSIKSRRGRSDDEPYPSSEHRVPAREASGGLNMHRQGSRHARPGDRIQVTTPHSSRAGTVTSEASSLGRSEEHTSELQSRSDLVCRLLLEKKKHTHNMN